MLGGAAPPDLCTELFEGNAQAAADWILQSQIGLKGQCPIDLLPPGSEALRDLPGRWSTV